MKKLTVCLLFLMAMFVVTDTSAQLGGGLGKLKSGVKGAKEKSDQKKKDKSPASKSIGIVEAKLSSLTGKSPQNMDAADIKAVEEGIATIKQKDPKWKVAEYEQQFSDIKSKYDAHHKEKRKKTIAGFLESRSNIESRMLEEKNGTPKTFYFEGSEGFYYRVFEYFKYNEVAEMLKEVETSYPELKASEGYKKVKHFMDEGFDDYLKNKLMPEMVKEQEAAKRVFKEDRKKANGYMKEMMQFADTVLMIKPDLAMYQEWRKSLLATQAEFDQYMNEHFYGSALHKDHMGQVKLFNKVVEIGKEQAADFKTSFEAGETIYGIFYRDKKERPSCTISLYVNGKFKEKMYFANPLSSEQQAYLVFPLVPDSKELEARKERSISDYTSLWLLDLLLALPEGKHQIVLKEYSKKVADFELNVTTAGMAKWKETYATVKAQRAAALRVKDMESSSSEIVGVLKKALKEDGDQILRVEVTQKWTYDRHKFTNEILSREAWGDVVLKDKNGSCYLFTGKVKQHKTGGGYSKPMFVSDHELYKNSDGNRYRSRLDGTENSRSGAMLMDCGNVNK